MPLLTVRLTDEDYAALKSLAGGSSMAELVRSWIAADPDDQRIELGNAYVRIAELSDEVKVLKRELALRPGKWETIKKAKGVPAVAGEDGPEIVASPARFGAPKPAPKPGAKKR